MRIQQGYSRGTVRVRQLMIRDLAYFDDGSSVLRVLFSLRVSFRGKVATLVRYHRILSRLLRTYYVQATIQDQIQSQRES